MDARTFIDVLDPVHFHGALPFLEGPQALQQATGIPEIHPTVRVFYRQGNNLEAFKGMLTRNQFQNKGWDFEYNKLPDSGFGEDLYGDVLVVACPNVDKLDGIRAGFERGYRLILADKPWIKEPSRLTELSDILCRSEGKTDLVDLMTERHELGTIFQFLLVGNEGLFGELLKEDNETGIQKSSVHILDKSHMGVVRPPQYFDIGWQGHGITDVSTHLVDMANMLATGRQESPSLSSLTLKGSRVWPTFIPMDDYNKMTGSRGHHVRMSPDYTMRGPLPYFCNGEFGYSINGIRVHIKVSWNLNGGDDTHESVIRGTKAIIRVIKGENDKHQRIFFLPRGSYEHNGTSLKSYLKSMEPRFGPLDVKDSEYGFEIVPQPGAYSSHFQHFGEIAKESLRRLAKGDLSHQPLENQRVLAKYTIIMKALENAMNQTTSNERVRSD
ncbi:hypothetical protein HYV84_03590 [Candidatus Woesearchaeota archaeon]|nr:hypothetical protein [Candidatus Woesearchaeota archaeon]